MDFVSNQEPQNKDMLAVLGINSIEQLFEVIPKKLRISKPTFDDGISEFEGLKLMKSLAAKNTFQNYESYLGAGAYEHHVPALVSAICSKSEFLTAYTPYQPEASQGMLQAIFEFQSAMCALTGLDVANASVYDGASACAEALLMALRFNAPKKKILIAKSTHPHYREVISQYVSNLDIILEEIPYLSNGLLDINYLTSSLDTNTAAILLQYPNFFGGIEDVKLISGLAKQHGALTVLSANPMVYGLYASAEELGVDIAVGDCQPLGISLQFGGPYAGYITCKQELIRQLPGRIVGETLDLDGKRGYVLTLQAREQHIRREKATSNICTNQALSALACLVATIWYGKEGMRKVALTNYQRATYLRTKLNEICEPTDMIQIPIFNEFVVKFTSSSNTVKNHFRNLGIEPGLDLEKFYPELSGCFLVAVTETKSKQDLDRYFQIASELT